MPRGDPQTNIKATNLEVPKIICPSSILSDCQAALVHEKGPLQTSSGTQATFFQKARRWNPIKIHSLSEKHVQSSEWRFQTDSSKLASQEGGEVVLRIQQRFTAAHITQLRYR